MKKLVWTLTIAMLICLLPAFAHAAASIPLTWDAPTTRTDGTTMGLDEIQSYTVYYDTITPPAAHKVELAISGSYPSLAHMTYTLEGLTYNTQYYLGVTATDIYDQESTMSNIVTKVTGLPAPPNAPPNFAAPVAGVE